MVHSIQKSMTSFEGPKLFFEGSFFHIFVVDSNLVEPTDTVDLCEDCRAPQRAQYGLN